MDNAEYYDNYDPLKDNFVKSTVNWLKTFFNDHKEEVYYIREIQTLLERENISQLSSDKTFKPYHWTASKAIELLIVEKYLKYEYKSLKHSSPAKFVFHKSNRYVERKIKVKIDIINKFSDPKVTKIYGDHAEHLFQLAFFQRKFSFIDKHFNKYKDKKWERSNHNLDFGIEKDGISYGCEVKNTLGYIDRDELEIKLKLCEYLGLVPLFIMRHSPYSYNSLISSYNGFFLIFETQIYSPAQAGLVKDITSNTLLPVMVSSCIPDGIIDRFENWHNKQIDVNFNPNSHI